LQTYVKRMQRTYLCKASGSGVASGRCR